MRLNTHPNSETRGTGPPLMTTQDFSREWGCAFPAHIRSLTLSAATPELQELDNTEPQRFAGSHLTRVLRTAWIICVKCVGRCPVLSECSVRVRYMILVLLNNCSKI